MTEPSGDGDEAMLAADCDSEPHGQYIDRTKENGDSLGKQRKTALNHFARFAKKLRYTHEDPTQKSFYESGPGLDLGIRCVGQNGG